MKKYNDQREVRNEWVDSLKKLCLEWFSKRSTKTLENESILSFWMNLNRVQGRYQMKKGSQQRTKAPMMMPSVRAALCSRFSFIRLRSLVGVEWTSPASTSSRALRSPPLTRLPRWSPSSPRPRPGRRFWSLKEKKNKTKSKWDPSEVRKIRGSCFLYTSHFNPEIIIEGSIWVSCSIVLRLRTRFIFHGLSILVTHMRVCGLDWCI